MTDAPNHIGEATKKAPDELLSPAARQIELGHKTGADGGGANAHNIYVIASELLSRLASQEETIRADGEALKPFALASDKLLCGYDDGIAGGDHPMSHVFVSDLRAARARLSARQERGAG